MNIISIYNQLFAYLQGPPGPPGTMGPVGQPGAAVSVKGISYSHILHVKEMLTLHFDGNKWDYGFIVPFLGGQKVYMDLITSACDQPHFKSLHLYSGC